MDDNKTIPKVDLNTPYEKQIEMLLPYAVNLYMQDLMGLNVSEKRLKTAKDAMNKHRSNRVDAKEKIKTELMEKKYKLSIVNQFGDAKLKSEIKKLVSKEVKNIKLLG